MNISLIEFLVYGSITYASFIILLITVIRAPADKTRKLALVKVMYMIPGVICAIILSGSGVDITLNSNLTNTTAYSTYEVLDNTNTITVLNSTVTQTEAVTEKFVLENPVWVTFHYLLALIMIVFLFIQVFTMLTAKD